MLEPRFPTNRFFVLLFAEEKFANESLIIILLVVWHREVSTQRLLPSPHSHLARAGPRVGYDG